MKTTPLTSERLTRIKGIGEKTAEAIIEKYETEEGLIFALQNDNFTVPVYGNGRKVLEKTFINSKQEKPDEATLENLLDSMREFIHSSVGQEMGLKLNKDLPYFIGVAQGTQSNIIATLTGSGITFYSTKLRDMFLKTYPQFEQIIRRHL